MLTEHDYARIKGRVEKAEMLMQVEGLDGVDLMWIERYGTDIPLVLAEKDRADAEVVALRAEVERLARIEFRLRLALERIRDWNDEDSERNRCDADQAACGIALYTLEHANDPPETETAPEVF